MPRRKKGGSRGDSPDKFPSFSTPNVGVGQGGGVNDPYGGIPSLPAQTSWVDVARQGVGGQSMNPLTERDKTFIQVQEMFKDKVDAEVIYMVLSESHWKGSLICSND